MNKLTSMLSVAGSMLLTALLVGTFSSAAQAAPGDTPGTTTDTHTRTLSGPGSVTINVLDEQGNRLPAKTPGAGQAFSSHYAFFLIKGDNGVELVVADQDRTIRTAPLNDSNSTPGVITVQDLPYGTYTITEIYQPDGYALSAAPTTVTVAPGSENATVSVSHTRGADLPYGDTFSPDLDVKITADTDLAEYPGQVITFTIDITNTGNTVLNGLDAGFHRFSASNDVKDNPYSDLPGSPTANSDISDDYLKSVDGCVSKRFLAPGESVTCQVQYTVSAADLYWASNKDANDDYDLACTIMFSDWFTAWDRYNTQFNQTTATGVDLRENPATYAKRNPVIGEDTLQIRTPCYGEPAQLADDAILEITNSLSGDGADEAQGPFIVEVDCAINGTSLPGFPRTVSFDGPGSQQIAVEAGATCRLTSIDRGNASGASITTNDVVMESGKTVSVAVDHVFGSSTVPPSGSVVLPAQGGNQAPAAVGSSAGSAAAQGDLTLAVTGAPIAAYLSAGSIAALLGAALLVTARRRQQQHTS